MYENAQGETMRSNVEGKPALGARRFLIGIGVSGLLLEPREVFGVFSENSAAGGFLRFNFAQRLTFVLLIDVELLPNRENVETEVVEVQPRGETVEEKREE